jgi:recombinational DNA repair ATPase RecF
MNDADQGVYELLFDRLAADEHLSERCRELVLAAFEGEEQLAAAIAGEVIASRIVERRAQPSTVPQMFLSAISVQGFRGIGPVSTLPLRPGPGLTIVTGRNGSGKSSFAEAAELVLTGDNKRWSAKENNQRLWRDGWRNLHGTGDGPACIGVDLMISGEPGPTALRMTWSDGADLDDGKFTRQRHGAKRETFDSTLWPEEFRLYRPFLSYNELGALLDGKPTQLHAALYRLLGLGSLDLASERLKTIRGELDRQAKETKEERTRLVGELGLIDDDRARAARELMDKPAPNLSAVAELALGDDTSAAEISALRVLAALPFPSPADVAESVERIRAAAHGLAEARTTDSARADEVAALLRLALTHQADEECACPVCGVGTLNTAWRERATAQVQELERVTEQLRRASDSLATSVAGAMLLITPVPSVLTAPPIGVNVAPALDAWRAWEQSAQITEPERLATRMESAHHVLATCLAELIHAAQTVLSRLDEIWRPIASQLFAWHDRAQRVARDAPLLRDVKKAVDWIKDAGADLRDQRMSPFAAASQRIWEQLRQQSNVDLGAVRLTGAGSARKVVLDVTVDGTAGAALSVMSQGELHALALSLFLPRATVDESPFQFMVIDDPVQAMDPAKVEGLARVLAEVARTGRLWSSPMTTGSPRSSAGLSSTRPCWRYVGATSPEWSCASATIPSPAIWTTRDRSFVLLKCPTISNRNWSPPTAGAHSKQPRRPRSVAFGSVGATHTPRLRTRWPRLAR